MRKVINKLTLIYYGFYVLAIGLAAIGYAYLSGKPPLVDEHGSAGIALSSAYIVLLVASIPLALKLFSMKVKKLAAREDLDEDAKAARYLPLAAWRLVAIGADLLVGIALFYLLGSRSMVYCAAIAAVALVFCKPSEVKADNELRTMNN